MVADFDRSSLQTPNRFGQLSKNMFFARHVPQPKFLKFITGTAGVRVCHVRDDVTHLPAQPTGDLAKSLFSDPRFTIEFPPNSYNEALLRSYAERIQPKKRRERFLPPIRGWNPSGSVSLTDVFPFLSVIIILRLFVSVADTEHWRRELTRIAEMVGLVTADELAEIEHKKETTVSSSGPRTSSISPLRRSASKSASGEYSQRTGRWNETPRTLTRSRSLNRRTPLSAIVPNHLFCVDEQERELWMLQVLCQILKTENINEVQAWLTASTPNEKEAVRQLITSAIKGLEDTGRIQPTALYEENGKGTQVNMDTLGSLISNKYPHVPSDQPVPIIMDHVPPKPMSRPRASPATQSTSHQSTKSNEAFQTNLQPINEETHVKPVVPQPTRVDAQRDIQVLTLNDDASQNHQPTTTEGQDEVPF